VPLPKLLLVPESNRYSASFGAALIGTQLAGGRRRGRLDQLGAPVIVGVEWQTTVEGYAYLGAFYRSRIADGSEPFLIDLPVASAFPVEQEARFMPGSFTLSGVSGALHVCNASLEVVTPVRDDAADNALIAARGPLVAGLRQLGLTPSIDGYGVQRGDSIVRSQPGLGPSAIRLDFYNTPSRVSVSWNVGAADYNYLVAFYFTAIREGALPFLMDVVLDDPLVRQLQAMLVPGSFVFDGVNGMTYRVRAEVEVSPIRLSDSDELMIDMFETEGEFWGDVLLDLDHLVTVTMPRVLG
jgi:hypothetical protein